MPTSSLSFILDDIVDRYICFRTAGLRRLCKSILTKIVILGNICNLTGIMAYSNLSVNTILWNMKFMNTIFTYDV